MATTFVGSVSLDEAFPGFVAVLAPLRGALASLRVAAQAALSAVAEARLQVEAAIEQAVQVEADLTAALGVHLDGLLSAKAAIRLKALADLEVQLQAALAIEADLGISISDPTAAISGLISAVASVQVDLAALVPQVALSAQLDAALTMKLEAEAKIAAFDLVLGVLGEISTALKGAVEAVLSVSEELRGVLKIATSAMVSLSAALQAAFDLTLGPLDAALDLEADLAAGPAEVYRYDGALSGAGASLDSAFSTHSAIPGASGVRAWLVVAPDSNPSLQGKLNLLLKTSP